MPPAQCPNCGRFLKLSLVASLTEEPAACPGCDIELHAEMFGEVAAGGTGGVPDRDAGSDGAPPPQSPTERAEAELHGEPAVGTPASVRPPDLSPDAVRDDDVLRGWDAGVAVVGRPGEDRPPFPTDAVVVAGAGVAGLLLGLAVGRDRRLPAAAAGAVTGVVAAGVARRIWRLDP